ncbi:hypothetical protein JTB14_032917 [Gonioctena quinquepunctata]|nr:hypothetical protein JTB14_032917 [Gonioctena quinquepunctata]
MEHAQIPKVETVEDRQVCIHHIVGLPVEVLRKMVEAIFNDTETNLDINSTSRTSAMTPRDRLTYGVLVTEGTRTYKEVLGKDQNAVRGTEAAYAIRTIESTGDHKSSGENKGGAKKRGIIKDQKIGGTRDTSTAHKGNINYYKGKNINGSPKNNSGWGKFKWVERKIIQVDAFRTHKNQAAEEGGGGNTNHMEKIKETYKDSINTNRIEKTTAPYWWNEMKLRRTATRMGVCHNTSEEEKMQAKEAYKNAERELRRQINASTRQKLCQELENDVWGQGY